MTTRCFRVLIISLAMIFAGWGVRTAGWFTLAAADFRFTSIRVTNNDVLLNWNAPGGSNYVLQTVTPLGGPFTDLGPSNFVPGGTTQALSYTNIGARTGAAFRFYRVRSFPPPSLQIVPTNVLLGMGMTNRYKVMLLTDGVALDVTTNTSLTFTSLNSTVAAVTRRTNGYIFVRGVLANSATLRASYLGVTNTATVEVSPLLGLYTVPALFQINGYVGGSNDPVTVFGQFSGGRIANITLSCNLGTLSGGAPVATGVDYNVRPNVANSFALITGQSAAVANDLVFQASGAGQNTSQFGVNWYWFSGITLVPNNGRISVGATQQFSVIGHMANGMTTNALAVPGSSPIFTSSSSGIAQTLSGLRVEGRSTGRATLHLTLNNGPGVDRIATCTTLEVGSPTNAPSNVDSSFNCCGGTSGSSGYPVAIATQPDGRVLIGGSFFTVNGIPSPVGIQRLLPDGNVDPTFRRSVTGSDMLNRIVVQPDGKILIAQVFYSGSQVGLVRLNPDGSFDETFLPVATTNPFPFRIYAMVLQTDGRILIGGDFTTINGIPRNRVARVNADGSLDETFNAGAGPNNEVRSIATDSFGRIYIGGNFTNVSGVPRLRVARLNQDGTVDASFGTSVGPDAPVLALAVRESPTFSVLVAGQFLNYAQLFYAPSLVVLDSNGLLVARPFSTTNQPGGIGSLALQPDGKAVVAGGIGLARRLTISNTLDTTFAVPGGLDGGILDISIRTNATIDIAGIFDSVGGLSRRNVARLWQNVPRPFAQWNFNSPAADGNTATGTLNPSLGTGSVSFRGGVGAAGAGEFASGSGNDTNATDNSAWNTSSYPPQGTSNKLAGVQFNASTVGQEKIVITWDQRVSNTGSRYMRLQYSTNGVSFVDFPTAVFMNAASVFESKTNSLQSILSVNNNSNFAFRIVAEFENTATGTGGTNYVGAGGSYAPGGTLRFDQVTVSGVPLAPP